MKYLIVNGVPRSGKDTFCEMCLKQLNGRGTVISTVDFVKEVATFCGWDGEKSPRNRKFLSDLKDLLTEWAQVPYNDVIKKAEAFADDLKVNGVEGEPVIFVMCREPAEIKRFEELVGAKSILVHRTEMENLEQSNHADSEVFNHSYHIEIYNDSSLETLEMLSTEFLIYCKEVGFI